MGAGKLPVSDGSETNLYVAIHFMLLQRVCLIHSKLIAATIVTC